MIKKREVDIKYNKNEIPCKSKEKLIKLIESDSNTK